MIEYLHVKNEMEGGSTDTKIGTMQRRLARPLNKDNMQIHEASSFLNLVSLEKQIKNEIEEKMDSSCGYESCLKSR